MSNRISHAVRIVAATVAFIGACFCRRDQARAGRRRRQADSPQRSGGRAGLAWGRRPARPSSVDQASCGPAATAGRPGARGSCPYLEHVDRVLVCDFWWPGGLTVWRRRHGFCFGVHTQHSRLRVQARGSGRCGSQYEPEASPVRVRVLVLRTMERGWSVKTRMVSTRPERTGGVARRAARGAGATPVLHSGCADPPPTPRDHRDAPRTSSA